MLINLITGNPIKSKEIFDELYAQYLSKVESQELYHHCENRGIIVAKSIYDEVDYVLVGSILAIMVGIFGTLWQDNVILFL